MRFAKWEGLGNDYLIVESEALPGPLSAEAIGLLCDRHLGVGGDGILVHMPPSGAVPGAAARMRIYNPDGGEPEMCGNGIRMFARYLRQSGAVGEDEFVIETLAGPIGPRLLPDGRVRVHMGTARFGSDNIAIGWGAGEEVVRQRLEALGAAYTYTFVDVGNPHCVIGVGETQACGTGATAVGAAAVRLGLAQSPVTVHLLGGELEIEVAPDYQVIMTGPAEEAFSGELSDSLMARLGWE